jgi:hypothetical protein
MGVVGKNDAGDEDYLDRTFLVEHDVAHVVVCVGAWA